MHAPCELPEASKERMPAVQLQPDLALGAMWCFAALSGHVNAQRSRNSWYETSRSEIYTAISGAKYWCFVQRARAIGPGFLRVPPLRCGVLTADGEEFI